MPLFPSMARVSSPMNARWCRPARPLWPFARPVGRSLSFSSPASVRRWRAPLPPPATGASGARPSISGSTASGSSWYPSTGSLTPCGPGMSGMWPGGLDRTEADSIRKAANLAINRRLWVVAGRYLSSHTDDELSAVLLLNQNYTEILPAIRRLSPEVRNGRFRSYIDVIESIFSRVAREQQAAAAARPELEVGRPAPDFTLKDINGEEFRLSALFGRGKYVVVDFWGSWCSWCIREFPTLEEYCRRYGERLEIVGVACNDRQERWRAAVAKNRMPWLQVFSHDGTTEVRYGVTAYPFKVVLSPEGRVLACFKGSGEAFYRLLDRLLQGD